MADDTTLMLIIVVAAIMIGVIIFEIFYIRSKRLKRRLKEGKHYVAKPTKGELRDDAHNALITGRAIARTLVRSGTPMGSIWDQLEEAEKAFERDEYKTTIDVVEKAKESMKYARLTHQKKGDVMKLESTAPSPPPSEDEMLTKEFIQKKLPDNFMQAKFSLGVAQKQIEESKSAGVDVSAASSVLQDAEKAFENKDYTTALREAIRSKNMVGAGEAGPTTIAPEEEVIEITEEQYKNKCEGCGEFLSPEDSFCRKCGAKVPKATECDDCGKTAEMEDKFCRECGKELPS
ncbi:MAG: zinc ribbon domain-containing protein [Methanobacteriota archaeon]|nr:MAG: zinc ribbon domain-containing protein [Euryarchaeota archaeon]